MLPDRPRVDLVNVRVIGAIAMTAFSLAAVMAWRAGDGVVCMLFVLFAALGLYLVLGSGQVVADSNGVTLSSVLGHDQLAWHQVRRVETSAYGTLVLHGENARLVVPPPLFWSGPHKQALRALIKQQLREHALVPEPSRIADYTTNKNVRIKRAGGNESPP